MIKRKEISSNGCEIRENRLKPKTESENFFCKRTSQVIRIYAIQKYRMKY